MLQITGYGKGKDYSGLTSTVVPAFGSVDANGNAIPPPADDWAGYEWHPVEGAAASYPSSYVNNDTWVSGGPADVTLHLSAHGVDLPLQVHRTLLAATFAADHLSSHHGTLSGLVLPGEAVDAVRTWSAKQSTSMCAASAFDPIAQRIRAAADMLADTTQDPTKTCNGISIGVGFETKATKLGAQAPASTLPDPCSGM